ncbi:MAG: hypothetical protein J6J45_09280 [Clostridia bacterium]|nr:hypothetical protein [Clostridia bacterium]
MKKTIALIAAIAVAALSICTLSICAFADGETTTAEVTTEAVETTTEAAETTTAIDLGHPGQTDATTTEKADDATDASDADADKTTVVVGDEIKTNAPGQTAIDDPDETTKAPAAVDDDIPSTGSKAVVPAIALLALAGSVAVAVKAKKD